MVQPRMGMSNPDEMRAGLLATKHSAATTVGTITLDSYTRLGRHADARSSLTDGIELNGYPIVAHDTQTTQSVLSGIRDKKFPVQVRHGSADPLAIFQSLIHAGLDATEGGPVSYCLPYSRLPLRQSIANWAECCELLATTTLPGTAPHLETFGGCLLGQLCPPSLLVAMSVLEALFFRQHGIRSISLSYAQQTSEEQDHEAIAALYRIADDLLPDIDQHIVLYTYMGLYPRTSQGASALLERAAALATCTRAARLIVKTTAEAHRVPTIDENVAALETAAAVAARECDRKAPPPVPDTGILAEALAIIDCVLELHDDIGVALSSAFACGRLDVPYCLHPDNTGRTRSVIDGDGRLQWSHAGAMPVRVPPGPSGTDRMTSSHLLSALSYMARKFDHAATAGSADHPPTRSNMSASIGSRILQEKRT
ncbi:methylaspartate mutase [Streptomyces sp. NPDC021218]|uniref:methylaspartate mutase n=1 Tax=Streptomyces sp. NPDC021218 TaxID=3365119 RepID=UPI0037A26EE9